MRSSGNKSAIFKNTPSVTVLDNRGLSVRELQYHRHPDTPETTDERITRHQFDERGFLIQSIDPRLYTLQQTDNSVKANFVYHTSLNGEVLRTESADAGITLALNDIAGRPYLTVNATGVVRSWQYEDDALPGRPLSLTEQEKGKNGRITERFVWGGYSQSEKDHNLAGQCVRHYDTAGLCQVNSIALTGGPLSVSRQLLPDDADADWRGKDVSAWNALLAAEIFTTLSIADATGAVLTTTDAKGNVQRVAYDVAGLLSGSWLTLKGRKEQTIIASLTYSAAGQKLREEHGNGVVTTYTYEPETQRLTGIRTERPAGHASGAKVLQDLRYEYDPVGNVLKVSNDAEETRFWRNQKVVPENAYVYDSLYQLVSAIGREMANIGQQGSGLPPLSVPSPTDSSAYTNYTRAYSYDSAGNLTRIRHSAPATNNVYTTDITVSGCSNRGVMSTLTTNPSDVDALFTKGGQQKQLLPGQALTWTPRNELMKVTPVVRDGGATDRESYRYDATSQRILKVSTKKSNNSMQTRRVIYLSGLELRTIASGSMEKENLQVIMVGEAGGAQARVLHWENGRPTEISNDQVRFSYDNLIESSGLEVDGDGQVISLEEYYPYGGTAVWTSRSAAEADYKIIRYSGKEGDATGLYYYGYRYYQPWVGRWLSADPAGTVDGINLFRMVRNNPTSGYDVQGLERRSVVSVSDSSAPLNNRLRYKASRKASNVARKIMGQLMNSTSSGNAHSSSENEVNTYQRYSNVMRIEDSTVGVASLGMNSTDKGGNLMHVNNSDIGVVNLWPGGNEIKSEFIDSNIGFLHVGGLTGTSTPRISIKGSKIDNLNLLVSRSIADGVLLRKNSNNKFNNDTEKFHQNIISMKDSYAHSMSVFMDTALPEFFVENGEISKVSIFVEKGQGEYLRVSHNSESDTVEMAHADSSQALREMSSMLRVFLNTTKSKVSVDEISIHHGDFFSGDISFNSNSVVN